MIDLKATENEYELMNRQEFIKKNVDNHILTYVNHV